MTSDRVKQVKEAIDIVEVVGGYVALRPVGGTYKGLCPFHDDSRPSFQVDPRFRNYRCWACGKQGDVFTFLMERERVSFREALEMLARRAGIELDDQPQAIARNEARSRLLEVVSWAAEQYQQCLLEMELADGARRYLGERKLLGPTIRKFGVGYAPLTGDWLVQRAEEASIDLEVLEKVGLIARRTKGPGWYDRFRDRVMFPIRDSLGRAIAFGGRIMPSSPLAARAPKYYNSPDTPLFSKSEQVYGLDLARTAAGKVDYLAIVEGYTDVLMAHQCGIGQVAATMGTALTARHVHHLRRFVKRVVLVYDADAGGDTGVDRALEIFVSQEADLGVATLPAGLDPCDLLTQEDGAERFKAVLAGAVDALDFKLNAILTQVGTSDSIDSRLRGVDAVLRIIALAPELPGQAGAVKKELIVSRISKRLALKEETVWARLHELRRERRGPEDRQPPDEEEAPRKAKPDPLERQLLECLLAEPALTVKARAVIPIEEITHPGLQKLLAGLYDLSRQVEPPTLDLLRARLENPALAEWVMKLHEFGARNPDRPSWLAQLLEVFRQRRARAEKQELQNQLRAADDHASEMELLRQLQNQ